MSNWTLFSNHGHVLFCLARDSEARLRDVATDVGITERAVQKIVRDLQDGGMISVTKSGRRNCYRIHKKQRLRHELEASCKLRDLIRVVNQDPDPEPSGAVIENKTEKVAKTAHISRESVVDTGLTTTKTSQSDQPESTRRTPDKTEPGEPALSDSIEKHQGSLF
jgi:predicted ArsR family transcriptional regulator